MKFQYNSSIDTKKQQSPYMIERLLINYTQNIFLSNFFILSYLKIKTCAKNKFISDNLNQ